MQDGDDDYNFNVYDNLCKEELLHFLEMIHCSCSCFSHRYFLLNCFIDCWCWENRISIQFICWEIKYYDTVIILLLMCIYTWVLDSFCWLKFWNVYVEEKEELHIFTGLQIYFERRLIAVIFRFANKVYFGTGHILLLWFWTSVWFARC